MGKPYFRKEPKFLENARAVELKARQRNQMNSKEGLKARLAVHLAESKYAKQQLKTATSTEKKMLLGSISNNERQAKAMEKHMERKK